MMNTEEKLNQLMRLAVVAIVLGLQTACSTYTQFIDKSFEPILLRLPEKVPYPIARKLTYQFYSGAQLDGGKKTVRLVADGNLVKSKAQFNSLANYHAQPVSSGAKMSEVYKQRADYARRQGNSGEAGMYTQMSYGAAQQEIAFERAMAGTQLAFATLNAVGAAANFLVEKWAVETGETVANYMRNTGGAIGESAPENTDLELVLFQFQRNGGELEYQMDHQWEFSAAATLKDKNGIIWRSEASYRLHMKEGKISPQDMHKDYSELFYLDDGFVPLKTERDISQELAQFKHLGSQLETEVWTKELVLVSHAAIMGLYDQIEYMNAKQKPMQ